ncbi:MAG TPA: hypothetical protein VJQ56_02105 [Blastocatellia bacterium]|nr:hypothetical protein [Blastocatellia bacterium]
MRRVVSVFIIIAFSSGALAGNSYSLVEAVQPRVAHLKFKAEDLRALAVREVVVRSLATRNDKSLAGLGAVVADAAPTDFVESFRTLDIYRNQASTIAIGVFGKTPTLADLDNLTIDDKETYALSRSRVGNSDIKLTEAEIASIGAVMGKATRLTPQLRKAVAAQFKKALVARVAAYLESGLAGLGAYNDKDEGVPANEAFLKLSNEQAQTSGHCADLYQTLDKFPQQAGGQTESIIYWAKQRFGDMKPVINIVHMLIHKEEDRVYIASKQLYSSHYTEAGLSVAELIPVKDEHGQVKTVFAFSLRLQVDMLGGTLGFMKKRMAQPRLLASIKDSLSHLRTNMEARARSSNSVGAGY